ncbi:helix-turn-helix domain-containing protein, partial [Oligoflexia bacterium]|nr:helix-turn-helix domain-containing protein [Oligoflexia bacterium]
VYLALAELGKSTASLLAKRVNIPRTTAYSVLDNLVQKGVVSQEQKGASTFYSCNKPQALMRMVEREQEDLKQKAAMAHELMNLVGPYFKGKNFSIPKLQFFEGKQNLKNLLYDYLQEWRDSMSQYDYTWWGYQDHTFIEQNLGWLKDVWKTASPEEHVKLISNTSEIEQKLGGKFPARREIRTVPPPYQFSSTIWILGDYILLIMTRQKPHYAFQMRDPVFGENLRTLFQMLWQLSGKS